MISARTVARWCGWATKHRVHAGVMFTLAYIAFSQPSTTGLPIGVALVALGEATRVWACGYLERNVLVVRQGPYRRVRHPLYAGSLLIGIGLAITTSSSIVWLAAFAALYLTFYLPAMRVEELRLQSLFGAEYQEYMDDVPRILPLLSAPPIAEEMSRRFYWRRVVENREPRTIVGMAALLTVQGLKLL